MPAYRKAGLRYIRACSRRFRLCPRCDGMPGRSRWATWSGDRLRVGDAQPKVGNCRVPGCTSGCICSKSAASNPLSCSVT